MNSNAPLVSAVVPAYNAASCIGETLRSLVAQTYPKMEIVVVDDESCDDTVPLVAEMARVHPQIRLIQQPRSGAAAARNRGVQQSRGEFIAPVDADDIWFPDAAEKLSACLRGSEPTVALAYGWWATIDEEGLPDGGFGCSNIEGDVSGTLLCHNFLGNASSTMMRRECFEQVGGYDCRYGEQNVQGCEDWDLYLRIAERFQFRVVPQLMIGYRKSRKSMSSDTALMARSHEYLLRKSSLRHPQIPRMLFRLSRSSFYLYLGHECFRQTSPYKSYRWLGRALVNGPFFTLVRPGFYLLAAKNVPAVFGLSSNRSSRDISHVARPTTVTGTVNLMQACAEEKTKRRVRIRMKALGENILHRVVSRLPVS